MEEKRENRPFADPIPKDRKLGVASVIVGAAALACLSLVVVLNFYAGIFPVVLGAAALVFSHLQQRRYYTNLALLGRVFGMMAIGITLMVAIVYFLFVYLFIPFVF